MSAIGDVLRAVKDVLLLQSQVERMEEEISGQNARFAKLVDSVTDIDKRLYAIERMMDLGARQAQQKRIDDQ
jgi:uncharacterized protein YdcH (DUF465 family)